MSKILFVVHRAAPFPGGSEYFVADMAEECLKRNHEVTILAHVHQGNYNGVTITNDYQKILNEKWDMIIVHGGDVISQNIVHMNAALLKSPVCYMIIKPSNSDICVNGLKHHKIIAYSTTMDIEHCRKHNVLHKARRIRHGIVPKKTIVKPKVYDKMTYVSVGGFYPHKAMTPLAEAFEKTEINADLHLYGYGEGQIPKETDRIKVFFGKSKEEVMTAISSADGYIMNSYEEGFGLVLLEAMMNKTPWFARNIAGAKDMAEYGFTYENESELMHYLKYLYDAKQRVEEAYNYVMTNHTIVHTINDIEDIIMEYR